MHLVPKPLLLSPGILVFQSPGLTPSQLRHGVGEWVGGDTNTGIFLFFFFFFINLFIFGCVGSSFLCEGLL